jgi:hypothetical protein
VVAYAREEIANSKSQIANTGCICPKCLRELTGPTMSGEKDRYGRTTRTYFGWCLACDIGFEVVQFKLENVGPSTKLRAGWLINKYRLFKMLEGSEKPQPVTQWLVMNPLPEPAPVVTGQSQEFDKPFTLEPAPEDEKTIELADAVLNALKDATKAFESLLKWAKLK